MRRTSRSYNSPDATRPMKLPTCLFKAHRIVDVWLPDYSSVAFARRKDRGSWSGFRKRAFYLLRRTGGVSSTRTRSPVFARGIRITDVGRKKFCRSGRRGRSVRAGGGRLSAFGRGRRVSCLWRRDSMGHLSATTRTSSGSSLPLPGGGNSIAEISTSLPRTPKSRLVRLRYGSFDIDPKLVLLPDSR
jgi:hypothetical protein